MLSLFCTHHLDPRRRQAAFQFLYVQLGALLRVEFGATAEEVAVDDHLGTLDQQVGAVLDEALRK